MGTKFSVGDDVGTPTPVQNSLRSDKGSPHVRKCVQSDWARFLDSGDAVQQTGSSNNSALGSDIPSKFGVQIDFDIPKRVQSLKPKPEIDFRLYVSHIEKSI